MSTETYPINQEATKVIDLKVVKNNISNLFEGNDDVLNEALISPEFIFPVEPINTKKFFNSNDGLIDPEVKLNSFLNGGHQEGLDGTNLGHIVGQQIVQDLSVIYYNKRLDDNILTYSTLKNSIIRVLQQKTKETSDPKYSILQNKLVKELDDFINEIHRRKNSLS